MCRCSPAIRTPFCGKAGCKWPDGWVAVREPKPEGTREGEALLNPRPASESDLHRPFLGTPWECHCRDTAPYRCPACYAAHLEAEIATLRTELDRRLPGINAPKWLVE
jgi:hypothetical protein